MSQVVPILAVIVWVVTFFLYRPAFFRRPVQGGRRWFLALIQTIPLLLLVWLLGNPFAERSRTESREGIVLILVDDSPSMGLEDGSTGRPRIETAREWAESLLDENRRNQSPGRWISQGLGEFIPRGRSGSDFAEAFEGVRGRIPDRLLDAVVFVSDGRDRGEASFLGPLERLGVPVHTLGLGPGAEPDGLRIRWRDAPDRVQPGAPFMVRWSVDSDLVREEACEFRVVFASEEVYEGVENLPVGENRFEEWLTLRGETPGDWLLRVEANVLNRPDLSTVSEATVTVTDSPKTLLVLESEPTRLAQSLVQTALESGRFRVIRPAPHPEGGGVVWDLFRPPSARTGDDAPPWGSEQRIRKSPEEWAVALEELLPQASAVVLGGNPLGGAPEEWADALSQAPEKQRLDWLVLPGAERSLDRLEATALSNLLQRAADRRESRDSIRLLIAETGRDHPALAPLWSHREGVFEIGRDSFFYSTTPTTQVLLVDPQDRALVVQAPFGLGKATLISTSNLWRLRAYASATEPGRRAAEFLGGFWLGVLDDLSGGDRSEEVAVSLEPEIPAVAQSVRIRIQDPALTPGPPRGGLQLRHGDSEWRTLLVTPDPDWAGVGEAVWTPRTEGDYEIRYAAAAEPLKIAVSDRPSESDDLSMNESVLRRIAEASGGTFTPFVDAERAGFDLRPAARRFETTERTPLRHDLWVGVLVAGLFCLGWGLRRAWSLP